MALRTFTTNEGQRFEVRTRTDGTAGEGWVTLVAPAPAPWCEITPEAARMLAFDLQHAADEADQTRPL